MQAPSHPKRKQPKKTKFGQENFLKKVGSQWIFLGAVRKFWAARKVT